jgi:signal transduction histidine kinase
MPLAPESLAAAYSGRITTSLELNALRRVLLDEVVPSLLVRQFAHLELQNGALLPLFSLRVAPGMLPESVNEAVLSKNISRWIRPDSVPSLPAWVRLVIPVRVSDVVRGYWLLGQRDPDDHYSPEDIATLRALADQTALALVNIGQAEDLRALHFADIERAEVERTYLAVELHDDVLGQLAVLSLNLKDASPVTLAAYDQAVGRIRDIINGLRPAMLNYGLPAAFETLTDDLNDRLPGGPRLVDELEKSDIRFNNRVELHLFRIAQQACENAIRHAACRTIRITGRLDASSVELVVSDDGKGFPAGRQIDLPGLLADKHFGLAGMFERAALIGAELEIHSQPVGGCQVSVCWQKK